MSIAWHIGHMDRVGPTFRSPPSPPMYVNTQEFRARISLACMYRVVKCRLHLPLPHRACRPESQYRYCLAGTGQVPAACHAPSQYGLIRLTA